MRHTSSVLLVEDDEDHTLLMHIPVVVLTTSDLDDDLVHAYGLGANSFVRKPVDFDAFQRAEVA